ncbi:MULTISPECIES: sigma-70 family RNA polymerase sigma factor [Bizionia]|uniref:Sigma-70 family RNA polymerase sigma factor n=1 Tax=Bizionia algoritergicola TaxID=291187 RepID=A0A5D0R1L0_9FLAO|nr:MULTISPECIES: sigma-70 family RNA polymerase sigma factor [Bizionia]OBX23681.1 hypothetical protein BAA08_03230 [Bizionia sp. APA-3]TYB75402.1 sigma-70 family RNA polymerase sigma factor [Bizionia algoritergicola]
MIDEDIVKALKKGHIETLEAVYLEHKSAFIGFAKKYTSDEDLITDMYQDAIIALRENAINGELDNLKSEVKTYLFSIGKYKIFKALKQQQKVHLVSEPALFDSLKNEYDLSTELIGELTDEQKQLQAAFINLEGKCKEILTLFYYRGFTIDDITAELNYNNKDVTKSQKSRCLKALKAMIFN